LSDLLGNVWEWCSDPTSGSQIGVSPGQGFDKVSHAQGLRSVIGSPVR
jgi:formylglycine-generating enzyme required for sulfatase activity